MGIPRRWAGEPAVDVLQEAGLEVVPYDDVAGPPADVVALAADGPVPAALLDRLPRLRVVSFGGTGVWDLIDVDDAARRGITVCNVRDYAGIAVAEHTMALLLALAKRIPRGDALVRAGGWSDGSPWSAELHGATLGLVGLGSVGAHVARQATAFGMTVECWTRTADPAREAALGVRRVDDLDTLLAGADVVSLHVLLTPDTAGLLDARRIALLKPGALLVNTARGALVDETALAGAIAAGRIGGAALDVFGREPLPPEHPLRGLDRVVLSPHVGAATQQAGRAAVDGCLRNIVAFLDGTPTNVVPALEPA